MQIVDRTSGKSLDAFSIEANDDTFFSAGDAALSVGKTALSFLPFGMLIGGAVDVAQGAANHRVAAQDMLTRGFVMLSYRKVFGDKTYRLFAEQRKAAAVARKAAAAPVAAVAAASPTPEAAAAAARANAID